MRLAIPTAINRRGVGNLPVLLTAQNLNPFIDDELKESAIPWQMHGNSLSQVLLLNNLTNARACPAVILKVRCLEFFPAYAHGTPLAFPWHTLGVRSGNAPP
jgi:hypothetical protein